MVDRPLTRRVKEPALSCGFLRSGNISVENTKPANLNLSNGKILPGFERTLRYIILTI